MRKYENIKTNKLGLYERSRYYFTNQPSKSKTAGICHNRIHTGRMSIHTIKQHECLGKQCPFFEKVDHPYWEKREMIKLLKKQDKEAI